MPSALTAPGAVVEELEVPELGPVVVRGLLLRDRLTMAAQPADGYANAARMLMFCVLRPDHSPVCNEVGWEVYGTKHYATCVDLLTRAQRLSGMLGEEEGKP